METQREHFDKFRSLNVCVLIPTYNNAPALTAVLSNVLKYTSNILIVNDGSTDATADILLSYPGIKCIHFPTNKGKGKALRTGFAAAAEAGYEYVITMDSDGQHLAKDLSRFLEKLESSPGALIIGARNMTQENVPGKSSFGHHFSNFWFKVETGIKAPDTQSGYRLYPVRRLKEIRFFTNKFEFEIEVIVRSAWHGINIAFVEIDVFYPPAEKRITHFRPFQDFTRISILNTILVTIAFLYIKPRDFLRRMLNKEKFKTFVRKHIFSPHQSDELKSISIAFGVFMGIIPIWGFQLVSAIFLAVLLKLNKPLVIVAANVSIPPMIPLIIFMSLQVGGLLMGDLAIDTHFTKDITIATIRTHGVQYLYGSVAFAFLAALTAGIVSLVLFKIFKQKSRLAG